MKCARCMRRIACMVWTDGHASCPAGRIVFVFLSRVAFLRYLLSLFPSLPLSIVVSSLLSSAILC